MSARAEVPNIYSIAGELYPWASPARPALEAYKDVLLLHGRLTPAVQEAFEKAETITRNKKVLVYIAGALTGVDEQTKERYRAVSNLLETYGDLFFGYAPHLHGTDPINHPNVTPQEVRDIDNIWADAVADLHVNFLSPIAHGSAIEEGWAEKRMVPAVYLAPKDQQLSRLTRGMENVAITFRYEDFSVDGMDQLKIYFDEFAAWLRFFPNRDPREFFYNSPGHLKLFEYKLAQPEERDWFEWEDMRDDPVFPLESAYNVLVYVKDPRFKEYYGKLALMTFRWPDVGRYFLDFGYGQVIFDIPQDYLPLLSFWIVSRKLEKLDLADQIGELEELIESVRSANSLIVND